MRHWLQLATRSWRTRPARNALATLAVTVGVGVVVWVTCCYESVRRGVTQVVLEWIGRSHVIVESSAGVWGVFDESIEEQLRLLPGVVHSTTRTREYVLAAAEKGGAPAVEDDAYQRIELFGVRPERELQFRTYNVVEGRFLTDHDESAVVIERVLADALKLRLGDAIDLRHVSPPNPPTRFTIIGIIERRRASINQALMAWTRLQDVQALCRLPGRVKGVDLILADPSVENIQRVAAEAQTIVDAYDVRKKDAGDSMPKLEVQTTEAQHKKLGAAQGLLRFIMMLLSCVVLLTALFIILATMSMGVSERSAELGLLRCIGMTRRQLGGLMLLQIVPLGVVGTIVGVPLGLFLQWITMQAVPDYRGEFAINAWGIALAVIGGLFTTLIGAAAPALRAFRVSPVEAARPAVHAQPMRSGVILAGVGVVLLLVQRFLMGHLEGLTQESFDIRALTGVVLIYLGFAMMMPLAVLILGRVAVHLISRALALRPQLLGDEVQKSPFRSSAICCGLMVGLSLIVGLVVWGESVKSGWQFPKEFPDALLYTYESKPLAEMRSLKDTEGVAGFTVTDDFPFYLSKPSDNSFLRSLSTLDKFSRFLAIDPVEGFALVKLAFLEGDERDARRELMSGGHILVTREFSRAYDKHMGDAVTIWVDPGNGKYRKARFRIAGVVASPGLDIAMSFFNAGTYFQTYAVGAIIGTQADARKYFDREYAKLILFNFAFGKEQEREVRSESTQTTAPGANTVTADGRPTFALGAGPIPGNGPEEQVVNRMLEKLDYPPKAFVTARELKMQIDRNIDRVTLLLSAIPLVGLCIAALGLGNVMAANVAGRSREIAVLRAIGVTKNQMSRIVIGEALVLALLGGAAGLALGLVLGRTSNELTEILAGFRPEFAVPWMLVAAGMTAATLLCALAALFPARYASRSNIAAVLTGG